MPAQLPNGEQTFQDGNGAPLAGGTVEMYEPGTLVPKKTWTDADGTVENPNPIVLDAAGRAVIYGAGGAYRQIVKSVVGQLQWDELTYSGAGEDYFFAGRAGGSPNALTVTVPSFSGAVGSRIGFVADQNCEAGPASLIVSGTPYPLYRDQTSDPPIQPALDALDLAHGVYYEAVLDKSPESGEALFFHFRVPSSVDSLSGTFVLRAGDTMGGALHMATHVLDGLPDPVNPSDAANRSWVLAQIGTEATARAAGDASVANAAAALYPTGFRWSASFLSSATNPSSDYPGSAMSNAFNPGGGDLQIERRYLQFQVNGTWLTATNAP